MTDPIPICDPEDRARTARRAVLAMRRDIVVSAEQIATPDHLCGSRAENGVEALRPTLALRRRGFD